MPGAGEREAACRGRYGATGFCRGQEKKKLVLLFLAFSVMLIISALQKLVVRVLGRCSNAIWEWWFYCLSKVCDERITMMNYGFDDDRLKLAFPGVSADEIYCYQLYHYTATGGLTLSLSGLHVLEVGCGRGGGCAYMAQHLGARTVVGCDISRVHMRFCRRAHRHVPNLEFRTADAQELPFAPASFDVVVNVESSHCYSDAGTFFSEVKRVLVEGGYFLFADLRIPHVGSVDVHDRVLESGLTVVFREDITSQVLKGLDGLHEIRLPQIKKHVPSLLVPAVANLAATKGTKSYNYLRSGEGHYFLYVLRNESLALRGAKSVGAQTARVN